MGSNGSNTASANKKRPVIVSVSPKKTENNSSSPEYPVTIVKSSTDNGIIPKTTDNGIVPKTTDQKLKVVLFLGSVRENRLGLRVAKFMQRELERRNYSVYLFDPLEMEFPLIKKPVFFYGPERKGAPEWLLAAEQKVKEADAYVVVSGEYNHSIPPALSNMLDHFGGSSYAYKPSAIVCYSAGIFGGMRAAMQLRPLLSELGTLSVSNIFGIPQVQNCLDEAGNPTNDHMDSGAKKLLDQLVWYTNAMKNHRDSAGIPA